MSDGGLLGKGWLRNLPYYSGLHVRKRSRPTHYECVALAKVNSLGMRQITNFPNGYGEPALAYGWLYSRILAYSIQSKCKKKCKTKTQRKQRISIMRWANQTYGKRLSWSSIEFSDTTWSCKKSGKPILQCYTLVGSPSIRSLMNPKIWLGGIWSFHVI